MTCRAPDRSGAVGQVFSSAFTFVARKAAGELRAWGLSPGAPTGSGYSAVHSTPYAFVAMAGDGSLVAWGDPANGGSGAPAGKGWRNGTTVWPLSYDRSYAEPCGPLAPR